MEVCINNKRNSLLQKEHLTTKKTYVRKNIHFGKKSLSNMTFNYLITLLPYLLWIGISTLKIEMQLEKHFDPKDFVGCARKEDVAIYLDFILDGLFDNWPSRSILHASFWRDQILTTSLLCHLTLTANPVLQFLSWIQK